MQTHFTPEQLADPDMATSEQAIRKCVHCGFCLATCPTYVLGADERDSPRGRIWAMKDMLENERVPSAETVLHVDRCLSCLACVTTCPSGVDYRRLVDHARAYIEDRYRRPWFDRLLRDVLAWVLPDRGRFRAALWLGRTFGWAAPRTPQIEAMLRLANRRSFPDGEGGPSGAKRRMADGASDLTAHIPGPHHHASHGPPPPAGEDLARGKVALLRGCAEPVLEPNIQAAAERLLTRLGYSIVRPRGEGCCGALTHHLGKEMDALASARRNIDAWISELDAGLEAILITASGCSSVVKDYGHMFRDDGDYAEKAARVSAAAKDVTEFLAAAELPELPSNGVVVAHQSPCSLQHGQRVIREPRDLMVRGGFTVRVPAEGHICCGSAGTYNILQPKIAGELRARKIANLRATEAVVVASGNIGCIAQLAGEADLPVVHVVELLDWAYGGPKPKKLERRG